MAIRLKTRLLAAAAATGVMGLAPAALAQDAETRNGTPAELGEIVVTAQLREQDPIEVPFALTAYSGQFLEDLGVQEFDQLSAFVPGFLVQNQSPNNPGFVMRGITSDSGAATAEPRVSVFQDGVSISKSRGSYVELFDMERIEVAKGPQSTLYGRGALIGAVNLVQNRARPGRTEAYAQAEFGDEGYRMVEGALNLPVGDNAGLRLATRMKTRDGYVDNLLGGEDYNSIETQAFRLSGAWTPSDAMRFDLIANYQTDEASGTSFKSIAYAPFDPATGAVLGDAAPWEGAALTPGADFDGGKSLGLDREVWGVTGLARIELSPSLTLNSTTAYRQFDSYETFDADGVSLPILTAAEDAHGEQWSQEFRLNYDNGGRLSAFAGAGWFQEEGYQRAPTQFDERYALIQLATALGDQRLKLPYVATLPRVVGGVLTGLLPGSAAPLIPGLLNNLKTNHTEVSTNSSDLTSYDLFGDVTYRFTDRFEMSAGLRWTQDEKTTGLSNRVENGRSIAGGLIAVQTLAARATALAQAGDLAGAAALQAQIGRLLQGLATPGAANLPLASGLPLFGLTAQPTANNGDFIYQDHDDDGLTWRVTARYALSDDASLYANYARGRRPEILSVSAPSAPLGAPTFNVIEAETVDSYEVGAKTALMDGRLRLDGAVFHYAYENFQTTEQVGTAFITVNAGEAKAYGFEGQAFFGVTPDFDLFATYGYNHSRFESGARDGNRFRLSPDNMASIGALWRLPVAGGAIEIQPTYTWQSKVFFDDDNDRPELQTGNFVADLVQDEFQDSYGLLNLRVRYAPEMGNWGVEAFGENILDEEYIKDAGNTGDALGMPTFIAGRPAAYGVVFKLKL
ncbi:MAG: TonB-dependent receptor [Brevundimonas sp.]|uniref:TonB-dependent receptor n=1 Tax=Brevundimonas albigilva TaxID=1312364 RepID=A0ABY4SKY4_9CAUL|nr:MULTISPECIES: TonB-dependent receptor [Brevundimonas]PZU61454.1 MAG: TonB-dependent receptor [Brevundimonas sp.]UQV17886.1 TonB-dependent receptor [Brevundimonas albigilva]URI14197.1 TonB-dependent receptor [Brevundimonas albigilva]